jgi:hypothetical protein
VGILQNIGNFFADGAITTDEERQAEEDRAQADSWWTEAMESAPDPYALAGYGLFGGQMPDDYLQRYLRSSGYIGGSGAPGTATNATDAWEALTPEQRAGVIQQAESAYAREQLANDPLWGLNVADQSRMEGASADRGSIAAQRRALQQMQGIYDAGGYTDSERAQLQMAQRDAANAERSQRLAVQESARARGMGGGGMELMGALAAQQGGANRSSDWANQIAVAGQMRALQALQGSGTMAGQMRGQSFAEDAARRSAADAWNQYQTSLINDRQRNFGNAQQNAYSNQLNATAGATNQYNGSANIAQQNSNAQEQQTANMIGTAATIAATAFGGPAAGAATNQVFGQMKDAPGSDDDDRPLGYGGSYVGGYR